MRTTHYGKVDDQLAESLAWLNSPAAIAGEIARLKCAIQEGDDTAETRVLLADWLAMREAQRRLFAGEDGG